MAPVASVGTGPGSKDGATSIRVYKASLSRGMGFAEKRLNEVLSTSRTSLTLTAAGERLRGQRGNQKFQGMSVAALARFENDGFSPL